MNRRELLKKFGFGGAVAAVTGLMPKSAGASGKIPVTEPAVVEILDDVPVALHFIVNGQDAVRHVEYREQGPEGPRMPHRMNLSPEDRARMQATQRPAWEGSGVHRVTKERLI